MLWTVLATLAIAAPRYADSPEADEAKRAKGTVVVRELGVDVDGDGAAELAVVERDKDKTMRLKILAVGGDAEEPTFTRVAESTPRKADRLLSLEARELTGATGSEVIAVFEERSPDELVQHVRILGKSAVGVGELFAQSFFVPQEAKDPALVELGDATPRFAVRPSGKHVELAWVRGARLLKLPIGKAPAVAVIGAEEQLYAYQAGKGVFEAQGGPTMTDYAPARAAWTVEASSQVPKIWGTAQAFWGADGELSTAWSVAPKKGEWIQLSLRSEEPVQMIRVVPGCAATAQAWAESDRVRAFELTLSSGVKVALDRASWAKQADVELPTAVRAVGDYPVKDAAGVETGRQILVLLKERQPIRSLRLTITELEAGKPPRGRAREACVAELSAH